MQGLGNNECTGQKTIRENGQRNRKLSKELLWKKLKYTCEDIQNEQGSIKQKEPSS